MKNKDIELGESCYALFVKDLNYNNPQEDREKNDFIYDFFYHEMNKNKFPISSPVRLLWKITGFCNLNCEHCWANLYRNDVDETFIIQAAKNISEKRIAAVSLSGGEPLLIFDLLIKIIKIFKEKNNIVEIMTNGSLLDDNKIQELSKVLNFDTDVIQISLDGSTELIHNSQRNLPVFEKVINNIKKYDRPSDAL